MFDLLGPSPEHDMRDLIPAFRYIAIALGDEAPLVARRLSLGAGLALTVIALVWRAW